MNQAFVALFELSGRSKHQLHSSAFGFTRLAGSNTWTLLTHHPCPALSWQGLHVSTKNIFIPLTLDMKRFFSSKKEPHTITLLTTVTRHSWMLDSGSDWSKGAVHSRDIIIQSMLQTSRSVLIHVSFISIWTRAHPLKQMETRLKSRQRETKINSEQCVTDHVCVSPQALGRLERNAQNIWKWMELLREPAEQTWPHSSGERRYRDQRFTEKNQTQTNKPSHGKRAAWPEKSFLVTTKHTEVYL